MIYFGFNSLFEFHDFVDIQTDSRQTDRQTFQLTDEACLGAGPHENGTQNEECFFISEKNIFTNQMG